LILGRFVPDYFSPPTAIPAAVAPEADGSTPRRSSPRDKDPITSNRHRGFPDSR